MEQAKLKTILRKHQQWLKDKNKGEIADLANADLSKADLRGVDLSYADLRGADLSFADLREANFSRTNLRGANLIYANVLAANLSDADLYTANFKGADLCDVNFVEASLYRADLHKANLSGADLTQSNLSYANLIQADLNKAKLNGADLIHADFRKANLWAANLNNTNLCEADFSDANLSNANLGNVYLRSTIFSKSIFHRTNFYYAKLSDTIFNNVDLLELKGLNSCIHQARSTIDTYTLLKAGDKLPKVFLRGIGLQDNFIDYLSSLSGPSIQYYSCFISYSNKDKLFAQRLHNDLQNEGVRCWFAPEDRKIGDNARDTIFDAIGIKEKLLVIMSKESVNSDWVNEEVEKILAEEKSQFKLILIPIRIDDEMMKSKITWAEKLRNKRHIGDFTNWKEPEEYKKSFEKLLRDLKVDKG